MSLSANITEALQNKLIGDAIFSIDEIEEMKEIVIAENKKAEARPNRRLSPYGISVMLVLLVNLAKKWGESSESRFWQVMWEEILDDPHFNTSNDFFNDLEKEIKRNNHILFTSTNNHRQFCEFIKYHALAPLSSYEAFVQLVWSFYLDEELLDAKYDPDEQLIVQFVDWLRQQFGNNVEEQGDADFDFDGKTYTIRAALKYGFSQNERSIMVEFVKQVLACIDRWYYHESDTLSENSYISQECEKCIRNLLSTQQNRTIRCRSTSISNPAIDLSKVFAGFEINPAGKPVLFMPEVRSINSDAEIVRLEIFCGEERIKLIKHYVVGEGLKRRIKRIEVDLAELLQHFHCTINLRVELWLGDELKYDSSERLHRDLILFSGIREVSARVLRPGDYTLLCSESAPIVIQCEDHRMVSPCQYNIEAKEGNTISCSRCLIVFNDEITSAAVCEWLEDPIPYMMMQEDDQVVSVFSKRPRALFRFTQNVHMNSIGIYLNHDVVEILQTQQSTKKIDEYTWEMDTSKLPITDNSAQSIAVCNMSTGKPLCTKAFFVSNRYQVLLPAAYCFGNNTWVTLSVEEIEYRVQVDAQTGEGHLKFNDHEILITPPCLRWRIDKEQWFMCPVQDMFWTNDPCLHNNATIEVVGPKDSCITAYLNDVPVQSSNAGKHTFLLGDTKTGCREDQASFSIEIDESGHRIYLFSIAMKPIFQRQPLLRLMGKSIAFDARDAYIGDEKTKFELRFYQEEEMARYTAQGTEDTFGTDLVDGEYEVEIRALVEGLFEPTPYQLGTFEVTLGNPERQRFRNRILQLEKTSFGKQKGQKFHFDKTLIYSIEYVRAELRPLYQGWLISKGSGKERIFFNEHGDTLRIYFPKQEDLRLAAVNIESKRLTSEEPDQKNGIYPCLSVYYKEESERV